VAGCCECGDEPSGSCATELVSYTECHRNFFSTARCYKREIQFVYKIFVARFQMTAT
jgi:hypothetical protein